MNIRGADSNDVFAIGEIRVAAWRAAYQKFLPAAYLAALDPQANLDSLRAILSSESPPFKLRIAEVRGEAAGFAIVGVARHSASPGTFEIWALNVLPAFWRRGIGTLLVEDALREAKGSGAGTVELWCIKGNDAAARMYLACGFRRTDVTRITSSLTGHPLEEFLYAHAF